MEFDDRAIPLTRRQLEIWLSQETDHSGTEWQLSLFARIDGTVERDPLEWAIRQAVQQAEPIRAAIFEVDGQVFQRAIDYTDVELAFYDLSCSRHCRRRYPRRRGQARGLRTRGARRSACPADVVEQPQRNWH